DVAHSDDRHSFRTVPRVVERAETGHRRAADDFGLPNWESGRVPRVIEDDRNLLVANARTGAKSTAPFLDHHAPLFVHFLRVEREAAGEVGERRQTFRDDLALVGRQFEHVDGLVEARRRIDVRPEPGADTLEVAEHLARLEVFAAV